LTVRGGQQEFPFDKTFPQKLSLLFICWKSTFHLLEIDFAG